ncbi:MAG: bifunctional methionine sulfoxide reductase B/A protein [Draconibacterium sp.]
MKKIFYVTGFILIGMYSCAQNMKKGMENEGYRPLTAAEKRVIVNKGTERPFTGEYDSFYGNGTYVCKRCGAELYRSSDKFDAGCGWPSFDDEIPGTVKRTPDPDGMRTEITCNNCGAHLGHVFTGEGFTKKDTRHCVNSVSLLFVPAGPSKVATQDTAYFAGGCFWGVEYYMEQAPGVISAVSGYLGGVKPNPSYQEVSSHKTAYAETVRIIFDKSETNYEALAKLFFNIHDPTQMDRQGPDVGYQYRSEIFYRNMEQKRTAEKLIAQLENKGYKVATRLMPAEIFWEAEDYHQDYYAHKGGTPYCHMFVERF